MKQEMSQKELSWVAYKEAWNTKGSMDDMTPLEVRTAREHFDNWWSNNHE